MKINWFPGHMRKSQRELLDMMPKVDVVIEVLDARLPQASSNPLLQELRGQRPCIKLLNKSDLADPQTTAAWVTYFEHQQGVRALPIEAKQRGEVERIQKLCRKLVPKRGSKGRDIRALVVGIPNVGKSTLINTLIGRKIARVGDKPAITTCPQQVDLRNGIRLFDSPGLLWPNLQDYHGSQCLAASGAIGDNALDTIEVARFSAKFLCSRYPQRLRERYKLTELPLDGDELILTIGQRRGCLISGGEVDPARAAELLLREMRGGKLGRISFEEPPAPEETPQA